ncbi:procathepsin L-like [Ixodes scapularis]
MLCFFVVCFFVVAANDVGDDANLKAEWEAFKAKYGKSYASEAEEHFRMKVYMKKRQEVSAHNEKYANGEVSFYLGMNEFSDLRQKEFVRLRNGYRGKKFVGQPSPRLEPPADAEDSPLPESVDWRVKGAVTPVKNQRGCGSCWAFSATGALEGQYFIKTGKLVSLSEQNLNDCSGDFGNRGCCGGHVDAAFEYIKTGGGLDTEQSYPYTSKDDVCCLNKSNVGIRVSGFVDIENSEEQLKKAVATIGPISVAIDASLPSFKHYMGEAALSLYNKKSRLFSFGTNNALLEFVLEGTLQIRENLIDSKKAVDNQLKTMCEEFIAHTAQLLIGPIQPFLDKANVILQVQHQEPTRTVSLRNQPFAAPETVSNVVSNAYRHLKETLTSLARSMSLYLANKDTEQILFKPVKTKVLAAYENLNQIVKTSYLDEDQLIIACPSVEQINVVLTSFQAK